jgi:hypothetical protein
MGKFGLIVNFYIITNYQIMNYLRLLSLLFLLLSFNLKAQKADVRLVVEARKNAEDPEWKEYTANTIETLPKFNHKKTDPPINQFGAWKKDKRNATGFFRTEKIDGRWWIIDPEGYPFIHKGVVAVTMGTSDKQKSGLTEKYGTPEKWIDSESESLKRYGFNGAGAWSDADLLRDVKEPLVYTVIVNPMSKFKHAQRARYGGKFLISGWQGYRFDLVMVFDPEFDKYIEEEISKIAKYKNDKFLLGYFTDNELPWKNDALDRHLFYLAKDEPGYLAAKKWFEERKGKDATLNDITPADRLAFSAFYFETYIKKVSTAIKKYDPNHLYLGCRFNQEEEELKNPAIFEVAGKYIDIISINHYRKWEPNQEILANWEKWSGKPFMITEWYTKGEDSGLPNKTGAGWNVKTQKDRGIFYQNFTVELLKSKVCVGWHWFKYQDNDPEDLTTDISNRDSNKGIVDSNYNHYNPLLAEMEKLNKRTYNLIQYFDKK